MQGCAWGGCLEILLRMAMDAVTRSIATENKSYMGNGTYSAMSWYLQSSVSAWW